MGSKTNEASPSDRPAVGGGGDVARMASIAAFFITLEDSSVMKHRVSSDIIFALGCSSFTKPLNGSCSPSQRLELLDHILHDSFVNGPLRHSSGVKQK